MANKRQFLRRFKKGIAVEILRPQTIFTAQGAGFMATALVTHLHCGTQLSSGQDKTVYEQGILNDGNFVAFNIEDIIIPVAISRSPSTFGFEDHILISFSNRLTENIYILLIRQGLKGSISSQSGGTRKEGVNFFSA